MKKHPTRRQLLGVCALAGAFSGAPSGAWAGGFALIEHGASGLGNAYAGGAAIADDTSTIWFNPAGMSRLEGREIAVAAHVITSNTKWTDRGTSLANELGGAAISGPDTAEPGTTSLIPNLYYSAPINERWSYGLGIDAPYGSSTEYDSNWKGRYTTIKSGVSVIDFNPAVSYRLSDKVRLGFGVSLQYLDAELTIAVDSGAVCLSVYTDSQSTCVNAGLTPGVLENDGRGEITADSTAFGFNLGALFLPIEGTRIGVSYRHGTSHELDGTGDFTTNETLRGLLDALPEEDPRRNLLVDTDAKAKIDLPSTFSVSAAQAIGDRVELLADLTWYGWSSFDELRVDYAGVQPDTVSIQGYKDVIRVSAGLNYNLNDKLQLRTGVAYDEEAIPGPERRTARIPGNDRTWLAFGAGYEVSSNLSFDVGYTHLFLEETAIDNRNLESAGGAVVRGVYDSSVDIFSAQINWQFN